MLFNFEADRVYTVKDMYKYTSDHNVKLLSEYNSDFWAGYKANYQRFDRLFMKRFSSWFPRCRPGLLPCSESGASGPAPAVRRGPAP